MVSFNVPSELILVDHGTTTEEAATRMDQGKGKRGKGGDILFRYGNPQVYRVSSQAVRLVASV